jgi:hypothetical protein
MQIGRYRYLIGITTGSWIQYILDCIGIYIYPNLIFENGQDKDQDLAIENGISPELYNTVLYKKTLNHANISISMKSFNHVMFFYAP